MNDDAELKFLRARNEILSSHNAQLVSELAHAHVLLTDAVTKLEAAADADA